MYYTFHQNIHITFIFVKSHYDVLVYLILSGFPLDLLNKLQGNIYHMIPFSHTSYSRNVLLIYFVFWWHFSNNLVRVPRKGSFTWIHLEDMWTWEWWIFLLLIFYLEHETCWHKTPGILPGIILYLYRFISADRWKYGHKQQWLSHDPVRAWMTKTRDLTFESKPCRSVYHILFVCIPDEENVWDFCQKKLLKFLSVCYYYYANLSFFRSKVSYMWLLCCSQKTCYISSPHIAIVFGVFFLT